MDIVTEDDLMQISEQLTDFITANGEFFDLLNGEMPNRRETARRGSTTAERAGGRPTTNRWGVSSEESADVGSERRTYILDRGESLSGSRVSG